MSPRDREPIAIIGMACRFAGGLDSPDGFWDFLRAGGDSIGELPEGRWDWYASQGREHAAAVRDVTKRGAFLDDVRGFDADFFGITPREAALMDPQQRIVLELSWEALEHAGIRPPDLGGTDAGVFVGVGSDDYGRRLLEDLPRIEAWTGVGGAYCAVANRVSYLLDLRGPSMAVDTACSSSLVAIHLAVRALQAGECPVALAGGVLVMAAPGLSLVLDAAGATSPDGRSKSFDADADGYGRGEGGGVIVLKRLADARRDGDRVLAVLRGSAVHQDGKTNGIMAPNGDAQAHLMRRAYEAAGVDPATVGYVEAHGTGTRVGDPLEAQAMSEVFGRGRDPERPLLIGSVKPNVGHLEAGAGMAGVIKTVLALGHREIPPNLNFTTPNPAIPWDTAGLRVVTKPTPWPGPDGGGPRRAGVSGYGYGGTIAHVILEEAERVNEPRAGAAAADEPEAGDAAAGDAAGGSGGEPGLAVYPLAGASAAAVQEYAGRLADRLERDPALRLADVGHTLAHRRAHLPERAAVVADGRDELVAKLREVADEAPRAAAGAVLPGAGEGLVWVFSGHGSQWTGMARGLLAGSAPFAEVIDAIEPVFVEEMGVSPRATILSDEPQPVDVIQPMIFAVQVGLAAVWRASGVRPAAVLGHSVGEIAAAVTAGVLTLERGARLVCRRSVLLREVAGQGAMAMVNLPADEAERRLAPWPGAAAAVASSTGSTVISGDPATIEEIRERWRADGLSARKVDSDVAFHGPQMEPLLDRLAAAAGDLPPSAPEVPVYGTALADPRSDAPRDGAYWAANLRNQVRFAGAVRAAAEDGYRLFVEVSPHPVVEHSINETLDDLGVGDAFATHSLRRKRREREELLSGLGLLWCHGAEVDWTALWRNGALADLPATAWQRERHWAEEPAARAGHVEQHDVDSHTLLGGRTSVNGTTPAQVWRTHLDRDSRPYPGDHPVREVEIIPAAVLLDSFLTAATSTGPWPDLTDVALRVPVSVASPRDLQIVLQDGTVRLSSRIVDAGGGGTGPGDGEGWVTHTTAAIEPRTDPRAAPRVSMGPNNVELLPGYVIDRLASLGVAAMGFPWEVERIRVGEGSFAATIRADRESDDPPATWAPVLDAALSAASVAFTGPPILRMPAHIHRVTLAEAPPARAHVTVRVVDDDTVDVEITDLDGTVVGRLSRLRYGALDSDAGAVTNPRRLVHAMAWTPLEREPSNASSTDGTGPSMTLVGPDSALLGRLTERLGEAGVPHRAVAVPADLDDDELESGRIVLVVPAPAPAGGSVEGVGEAAADGAWLLASTAQRLAGAGLASPARLWCVTQDVRESAGERTLGHGPLWGLGRIIGGEHPEFWGGVVDIGRSPRDVPGLLDVVRGVRGEDVVVVRDGAPSVPRLRRLDGDPVRQPVLCEPDGTYLVTGGLGVLGLEVAKWLAGRGARRLVLAGRSAPPPRDLWDGLTDPRRLAQVDAIRSLERLGVTVVTVALDVADGEAAAKALSPSALGLPPIRGVVHAAGVLADQPLRALDEETLRGVLRPKVDGAMVLHSLFPPGSVDFFVLFSSSGQLLGLPGQAAYASGNAFLDALAAHRRAAGDTAASSLAWTSWRGLGMSTSSAAIDAELNARGTGDITLTEAFDSWELAERYGLGYAAVLRTIPLEAGERRAPLLSELPADTPAESTGGTEPAPTPWVGLDLPELRVYLTQEIQRQVATETKLAAAEVDPRRPLVEMGVDSVMTVRIRRGLERRFRLPLSATLFWDRPTIDAVAALLAERIDGGESALAG
ncbi:MULTISPECIES: type I polyketide synthase [Actinomadura]|uniref:Type I polyketide synthase n=1 Tax=Actinomadura yumaensis TaxID=111807 RepID=A0ABW2CRI6_9ACTN|nr:type I polyketide synthase [Actinomadura sp. J1-007]